MDKATCSLCGEPMPPGEEMFKYHGYSGPCPFVEAREAKADGSVSLVSDGETKEQLQAQLTEACKKRDEAKAERDHFRRALGEMRRLAFKFETENALLLQQIERPQQDNQERKS
jgi:chromosome segregation ATPase